MNGLLGLKTSLEVKYPVKKRRKIRLLRINFEHSISGLIDQFLVSIVKTREGEL